jgi:hypothetical protein
MKFYIGTLSGLILICSTPLMGAELLTSEEQSFETGTTPGRWQQFTWPDTRSGGNKPSPIGGAGDQANGESIVLGLASDAPAPAWGSSCLGIYDNAGGWDDTPDCGGVMITLDVLNGATYTISGYIKFATDTPAYNAAGGFAVDTDGGTDPLTMEYGYAGTGGGVDHNEYDPARVSDPEYGGTHYAVGEWLWNHTGWGEYDDLGQWIGPPGITLDIQATGDQMTVFIWGFNKFWSNMILFDGISVDGPPPAEPTPTRTPNTGIEEWSVYR